MIDEAILLIEKEKECNEIMYRNLEVSYRKRDIETRVKNKLKKKIRVLDFIIKILEKHKKEELDGKIK